MERGDLIAGRYRLEAEIGSGGAGEVWRATEQDSNAAVALYRVRMSDLGPVERDRVRERLRSEAGIALLLDHPHILSVHRLVEHGGDPWLVMEYVPAANLSELTTAGPLSPQRVARIGAQVADALAYAHSAMPGVVHRAVTPRNVLVREGDQVTLTGFGVSTIEGDGPSSDVAAYLAPEVANGIEPGQQADVFSLGATLYEAVEGRPPWGDGDPEQARTAAMKGVVEPPRHAGALGPVLMRMLQSRPRERPTAAAAAQMLVEVTRREPTDGRGERTGGRRWLWVAVAVVAVVAVAAAGLVFWPRTGPLAINTAPPPVLGDPATADPCSLIREEPFDRFGQTRLQADNGNFDRCDVIIDAGETRFTARVQFAQSGTGLPAGEQEERDGVVVVRGAPVNGECVHTLRLSDGYDVQVAARPDRGAPPDPCAIADVAADNVLAVLARGSVPRRPVPFATQSLAMVDACGLLDGATVAKVPGLEAVQPDPGFAGWDCDWEPAADPANPAAPRSSIVVTYDRDKGISKTSGNPVRIAGRDAAARVDDDGGGCDVTVLHRTYTDQRGEASDELLIVKVDQATRIPDPCKQAVAIATVAVERLPPAP